MTSTISSGLPDPFAEVDADTLRESLVWGAIGFGAVATLTPRVFESVYGLTDTGDLRVMTRLWGTRTAVLGLALKGADPSQSRLLTQLAAGMNLADAVIVATSGSEVNKRSRIMGALSSAAFAAAFGSLLTRS